MISILALALAATPPVPKSAIQVDYPISAMRKGEVGKVEFEIDVDASGQPVSCRVVTSSGHASLDNEACRNFKRTRFDAARDQEGKPVAGVYRSSWAWMLSTVKP